MIKLTYCLRRRAGMTWEEFSDYWRDVHAPLVRDRAEVLGIHRYVQVRTLQDRELLSRLQERNGGSPEPYDGIAELWYERLGGTGSPEARQAAQELLEDERNFIDLVRSPMWLGEEWEVVGEGPN
ncbi:MAG: EthD domain-containing protein [Dehalococcoidia bacterium]